MNKFSRNFFIVDSKMYLRFIYLQTFTVTFILDPSVTYDPFIHILRTNMENYEKKNVLPSKIVFRENTYQFRLWNSFSLSRGFYIEALVLWVTRYKDSLLNVAYIRIFVIDFFAQNERTKVLHPLHEDFLFCGKYRKSLAKNILSFWDIRPRRKAVK